MQSIDGLAALLAQFLTIDLSIYQMTAFQLLGSMHTALKKKTIKKVLAAFRVSS